MSIDDKIVVGMEYFLIPKYNGINAMPDAATAFINTNGICCMIIVVVNVSGINLKLSVITQKIVVTKAFDKIIALKVKRITMASFEAINFFYLLDT